MGQLRDRMDADLQLAGHSETTRTSYMGCAKRFVKYFMLSPELIGEGQVREFLLHLIHERNFAVGTRLVYIGAIKFLYTVTLKKPEVVVDIPWPRQVRRKPVVPTREEVRLILNQAKKTPYWHAFFLTAYSAGLRRSEICSLRSEDIDSAAGIIRVEHGKGDKRRIVRLDPLLLQELRQHWRRHHLQGPWLFPGRDRRRSVSPSAATGAFRKIADQAGLRRRLTLHNLRHGFATHLLESGVNLVVLQALLGHANIETTSCYTGVRTDSIVQVPSLLESLKIGTFKP